MDRAHLAVVGTGVIGLTTAVLAQESGHPVTVYSARPWAASTSMKAAASFKPHEVAYNELTHRMLGLSWEGFARTIADRPAGHGVRMHTHWEASSVELPAPAYRQIVRSFQFAAGRDIPGAYPFGWFFQTFFIDMNCYLEWLAKLFVDRGGRMVILPQPIPDLGRLAELPEPVVVNCTGLGAGRLCADPLMRPMKGQIVLTDPVPGMDWSVSADGFYIYPRGQDTVVGGTWEIDVEDERVDPGAAALIIRGNLRVLPALATMAVRRSYAGVRPYREESIRVEREEVAGKPVVHNYGHGGAGVTLSWGSARLALDLID
ncbi:MAG: FAD-dependent oxidoreductase [Actinomycetota bacterium]